MQHRTKTSRKQATTASKAETGGQLVLLAVGEIDDAALRVDDSGGFDGALSFVAFQDVSAELIATLQPDVVLSPLVSRSFDCLDLAEELVKAEFRGRYRAAAGDLPNPGLIKREIAASFPSLDFDILDFGGGGPEKLN